MLLYDCPSTRHKDSLFDLLEFGHGVIGDSGNLHQSGIQEEEGWKKFIYEPSLKKYVYLLMYPKSLSDKLRALYFWTKVLMVYHNRIFDQSSNTLIVEA